MRALIAVFQVTLIEAARRRIVLAAVLCGLGFVALFAFAFAVSVGALWEIFEFAADQLFGLQMQKPMLGDPSGLTDTMWDLIVDTLGAAVISGFGWWHMRRERRSFIDVWTDRFVAKNPRLFRR